MEHAQYRFLRTNGYLDTPKIMQIEITNICPLKCPYCYKDTSSTEHMPLAAFEKILKEAKNVGVKAITLLGGEPLLHPDIGKMLDIFCEYELTGGIYTSGVGLTNELILKFKNFRVPFYLFVSLNGSTEIINAHSRDGFEEAIEAMKILHNTSTTYYINWVARNDNIADLPNLVMLSKAYSAQGINIVCNKMHSEGIVDSALTADDYKLLNGYFEEYSGFLKYQNCFDLLRNYLGDPHSVLTGCQAGISVCAMDRFGRFYPCLHLNYAETHNSILEYWNNSRTLLSLREQVTQQYYECAACTYSNHCRFCRAMSKETHDDFNKGLIRCPIKRQN